MKTMSVFMKVPRKRGQAAHGVRLAIPVLALLLIVIVALAGCGEDATATTSATSATSTTSATPATSGPDTSDPGQGSTVFTLDELAAFDGKDGNAAYVAVDGVVYDVTGSRSWPEGQHNRCDLGAMAGKDLSEVIAQAPANMRSLLAMMPVVGELAP